MKLKELEIVPLNFVLFLRMQGLLELVVPLQLFLRLLKVKLLTLMILIYGAFGIVGKALNSMGLVI